MFPRLASLVGLAVVLAVPLSSQTSAVIVVDESNGPGTDFTSLQKAIDAAQDGDVLLIRDGAYFYATIDGKSLVLQSEHPNGANVSNFDVLNLDATQFVAIRGLEGLFGSFQDCQGVVAMTGGDWLELSFANCRDAVLRGTSVATLPPSGYECMGGVVAVSTTLFVYSSTVYGHYGVVAGGAGSCNGGPGIELIDSPLFLVGSTVLGGTGGGSGFNTTCSASGILVRGTLRSVEILDSQVSGGAPHGAATCPPPVPVSGVEATIRPGTTRRVMSRSPVREGEATAIRYHGEPGDTVWLALSPLPGHARSFPAAGYYHGVLSSSNIVLVGQVPASGDLVQSFTVPSFPGSAVVRSWYLQAYFLSAGGQSQISGPTQVHVLDSAY